MLAHGSDVPHDEIRGARATDVLNVRYPLWAFQGWVPVQLLATTLNVEPAVLVEIAQPIPLVYKLWTPAPRAEPREMWVRALRHADWGNKVRADVVATAPSYTNWRRLVKRDFPGYPLRRPEGRPRRAPMSATDPRESAPGDDSATDGEGAAPAVAPQ